MIAHGPLVASIAVSVIAASLVGCAQPVPDALLTSTPAPTPSATPAADPFALPESAFDVACDDLVPLEKMTGLYGAGIVPTTTISAGVHNWEMEESAARSDGALLCQWTLPETPSPVASVIATTASADQFASAMAEAEEIRGPAGEPVLDGAYGLCRKEYLGDPGEVSCEWSVYRDGVWVVASFSGIPEGEAGPLAEGQSLDGCAACPAPSADSLSTRIVIESTERLQANQNAEDGDGQVSLTTCDEILDVMTRELSGAVEVGDSKDLSSYSPVGGWRWGIGALASERQGWTRCFVDVLTGDPEAYAYITVARDAAWLLANDLPALARFAPINGAEGVSLCDTTLDSGFCSAAMVVGTNVVALTAFETLDQSLAEALIIAAAESLK